MKLSNIFLIVELIGWIRLQPNIRCLHVDLTELKYWFTHDCSNQYLDTFLRKS